MVLQAEFELVTPGYVIRGSTIYLEPIARESANPILCDPPYTRGSEAGGISYRLYLLSLAHDPSMVSFRRFDRRLLRCFL